MPKRPEDEHRSEVVHVRVRPSTKQAVESIAQDEDRKLSDMGSILLEEAVAARSKKRARR